ncbi:hypothetical protein Tco_1122830 [Tanacetum coccineum]|uniref:Uncharacterized protein n=1 Tax=Tanacetum coccineum TaxID=301880 RepID=A0ABQ5J2Z5_9ASTR
MWLPLRKRLCRTTPGPRCEVGESSAAGAARQFGPTTARADLYGFADTLEAAPGRPMSRELGYGIRDTWDDLVGAIQEIAPTTLEGVNQRVIELSSTVDEEDEIIYSQLDDASPHSDGGGGLEIITSPQIVELREQNQRRQTVISELLKADYRRQWQL